METVAMRPNVRLMSENGKEGASRDDQQAMTAILMRHDGAVAERRLSAISIFSHMDFSPATALKPFGELRRAKTEKGERKKARLEESAPVAVMDHMGMLPDNIWARIGTNLGALERMRLAQCCKRMRQLFGRWEDVQTLEIKPDWAGDVPSACQSPAVQAGPSSAALLGLPSALARAKPKRQPRGFRLRLRFASGRFSRIRTTTSGSGDAEMAERLLKTLLARIGSLQELTLWDACLSERFRTSLIRCTHSLHCLRLWNCHRWLDGAQRQPQLLLALLGLSSLRQLFLLDSSPTQSEATCRWFFSKPMARAVVAPLQELQLTNCRLPLRSLELLLPKCGHSLRRLAIGCTFGKEAKRVHYLRLLRQFNELADLDLPPFLFRLGDQPQPDLLAQRLFEGLPRLRALGFRHFNSAALFRFIESHLANNIRVLRIHHNAHRVPNFAELGLGQCPTQCATAVRSSSLLLPGSPDSQRAAATEEQQKKHSVISRCSLLSSASDTSSPAFQHYPHCQGGHLQQPSRSATFCAQPFSNSSPSSSTSTCSTLSWPAWPNCAGRHSKRAKSLSVGPEDGLSLATSSTWCTLSTAEGGNNGQAEEDCNNQQQRLLEQLARRKLTVFAIAEERQGGAGRRRYGRQQKLRRSTFAGVEVFYVSPTEALASQEVIGRMSAPIQSPYVYTTSTSSSSASVSQTGAAHQQNGGAVGPRGVRVIRGDLVRAIPLASLGMESDWESSDDEEGKQQS